MANFTQRTNGKWQAKIRRTGWPDQSKSFQTREDAKKWATAVEREMDIGAFINRNDAERTTFVSVRPSHLDFRFTPALSRYLST